MAVMMYLLIAVLAYIKFAPTSKTAAVVAMYVNGTEISSYSDILIENIVLWAVFNSAVYLIFYVFPLRKLFKKWKFNPMFPPFTLVAKEILRSIRGVAIGSAWEYGILRFRSQGKIPLYTPAVFYPDTGFEHASGAMLAIGGVILYLLGDFHFYWTHRMLHSKMLYKLVHKYHHESFNPTPFSGLSMHWLESFIYFSYAPLLGIVCAPYWMFRLASKGLVIFPTAGHTGYGSFADEVSCNHYIHHSKFDWNYGSSPLWDHIMRTNYDAKKIMDHTTSSTAAMQQAMLVGCRIGVGFEEPSVAASSKIKD